MLVPAPVCFGVRALQSCNIFLWFLRLFQQQFCRSSAVSPALSNKCLSHLFCSCWWVVYCTCLLCFISPVTPMFLISQIPGLLCLFFGKYVLIFFFLVVAAEPGCQCSGRKMSCLKFNSTHRIEGDSIKREICCLDIRGIFWYVVENINEWHKIFITGDMLRKNAYVYTLLQFSSFGSSAS